MAFTEFFCHTTGSNLNGGGLATSADPPDAAAYTGVGDSDGTSVFTPSDGSTPANTVNVGDWASIYVTAGATVAVFIGRVTAVAAGVNGAITVSTTAKSGTIPANSGGAHTITCKVGGAWQGPNGATAFPFGFVTNAQTDNNGDPPRVNLKNGTNYAITAAMTHANAGPTQFQGYAATAGDGGRAVIDGGTGGGGYTLLNVSGNNNLLADLIFQNNGNSGGFAGLTLSGIGVVTFDVIVHDVRGKAFSVSGSGVVLIECEAYNANQSNTASTGCFDISGLAVCDRCYAHDSTGSNTIGYRLTTSGPTLVNCIADTIGSDGLQLNTTGNVQLVVSNCDFYNCGGAGINLAGTPAAGNAHIILIENSNFCKNSTYGINVSGTGSLRLGRIRNCGFGSGSQANTSGQTNNLGAIQTSGLVTYTANIAPWNAPTTGNFTVTLGSAINGGRGAFTETGNGKTGTVGFPPIGAAVQNPPTPHNQPALLWNASPGATSYSVRRSPTGQGTWTVLTTGLIPTSYLDASAVPTVSYDYEVQAVGPGGSSAWSALATFTP